IQSVIAGLEAQGRGPVKRIETHASTVLLFQGAGYKIKKPVDYGFLDFSSPQKRRASAELEVELNRPLAPGVYLGVLPIFREADDSWRVGEASEEAEPDVEPDDWALHMARLPAERMLERLLREGALDDDELEGHLSAIVRKLAAFHDQCQTGPEIDQHATPEGLSKRILGNLDECRPFAGEPPDRPSDDPKQTPPIPARLLASIQERAEAFIRQESALLNRRVEQNRIREGHGDLHPGNICLTDDGPVIYDRLEFCRAFRCADVAAEIAYLAMELDHAGRPQLANRFVRRYATETADPDLESLQPLYRVHYAMVRSKVSALAGANEGAEAIARSSGYAALAGGYFAPPSLIMLTGLPATGKSTIARSIARTLRGELLRSDVIRKELAGMAPSQRPASEKEREALYSQAASDNTYAAMLDKARERLAAGRTVIADANFPSPDRREPFIGLARELGRPFICVHTTADESMVRERLRERRERPDEASDADERVYETLASKYTPPKRPDEVRSLITHEAGTRIEVTCVRVAEALLHCSTG
ncbi:MAG: hypothetical protein EA423_12760, partial [Phycisphaerales bacterium]